MKITLVGRRLQPHLQKRANVVHERVAEGSYRPAAASARERRDHHPGPHLATIHDTEPSGSAAVITSGRTLGLDDSLPLGDPHRHS